jgi:RHS repeat-associated protein
VRKNANGNLTEQGSSYTGTEDSLTIAMSDDYRQYRYDLLNRLTEVLRYQDGNLVTVARYGYDINSLRIYKEDGEGKTTRYVYDATGNRLETHSDETSSYYIFRGLRHVARRIVDNASQTEVRHYYGTDHLGSTVLVTGDAGEVLWSGETNPFGDSVSGEGIVGESERIKYTGKDFDEDAGLYYFNARWYDPGTGRFITEDPIRYGVAWYAYVANNPISYIDPSGLRRIDGDTIDSDDDRNQRDRDFKENKNQGFARRVDTERETNSRMDEILVQKSLDYSEYFGEYETGFNQIELLLWTYLDTGDEAFLDLMPQEYIESALFETAVQNALTIYYSDNPGETASSMSQRMAVASGFALGIGTGLTNSASINLQRLSIIQERASALRTAMNSRNTTNSNLLSGNRPLLSDQFASNGNSVKSSPVLGHYPEYTNLAARTGGRVFQVPTRIWDSMTENQQWSANQRFLDRAIQRGQSFRLATSIENVRPGSFFERELQYLQSWGYTLSSDGSMLLPPFAQ